MNKAELVSSASELASIPTQFADEYAMKQEKLVAQINHIMLSRPDIKELVGETNLEMMQDNHHNHARFVESILRRHNSEVLVETVCWVFRSYRSRGFHPNYWAGQINAWIQVLREQLTPDAFAAIYPLYRWFSIHIPAFTMLSDNQLEAVKGHQ